MGKKKICLLIKQLEEFHMGKDILMFPYWLGKLLNGEASIVSIADDSTKAFADECRGVKLYRIPLHGKSGLSTWVRIRSFADYLIRHAREMDVFIYYFLNLETILLGLLYKWLHPQGKFVIKSDSSVSDCIRNDGTPSHSGWRMRLKRALFRYALRRTDLVVVEVESLYRKLRKFMADADRKLVLMPNGFDEETLATFSIRERTFAEKENVFLTAGRLGAYQKNNELLLEALRRVDLKDWKFWLIGDCTELFQKELDRFYAEHPEKKEQVIQMGQVYQKDRLWEYYNRAKVFVMSSRSEGYPLVFPEAQRFVNYIVSTEFAAAEDVVEGGKRGRVVPQEDPDALAAAFQAIVDGKQPVDVYADFDRSQVSWERLFQVRAAFWERLA